MTRFDEEMIEWWPKTLLMMEQLFGHPFAAGDKLSNPSKRSNLIGPGNRLNLISTLRSPGRMPSPECQLTVKVTDLD